MLRAVLDRLAALQLALVLLPAMVATLSIFGSEFDLSCGKVLEGLLVWLPVQWLVTWPLARRAAGRPRVWIASCVLAALASALAYRRLHFVWWDERSVQHVLLLAVFAVTSMWLASLGVQRVLRSGEPWGRGLGGALALCALPWLASQQYPLAAFLGIAAIAAAGIASPTGDEAVRRVEAEAPPGPWRLLILLASIDLSLPVWERGLAGGSGAAVALALLAAAAAAHLPRARTTWVLLGCLSFLASCLTASWVLHPLHHVAAGALLGTSLAALRPRPSRAPLGGATLWVAAGWGLANSLTQILAFAPARALLLVVPLFLSSSLRRELGLERLRGLQRHLAPSPVSRAALRLVALNVAVFTALRVVFHLTFRASGGQPAEDELGQAFWLGLRFDLRLALLMVLPLLLLGHMRWLRPDRALAQRLWRGLYVALGLFAVLVYFVDLGHYDYLHTRINAALLNEARSVREAVGMVWSSYPILRWALGFLAIGVGYTWAVRACLRAALPGEGVAPRAPRHAWVLCVALVAWGIYGNASWYPLRWSQAYFSTNRYLSSLALNPVLAFTESFSAVGSEPDPRRLREGRELLREVYGVEEPDPESFSLTRWVEPARTPDFRPNLVVIHVESWAAFQNGFMGNPLDSSPNMDALAAESLVFERCFVPTGPTARSVFSMLTGVPDTPSAKPMGSASRDPLMVEQNVIVNAFEGWRKFYFLGGSANWANIRSVTQGNIDDLTVYEEGSYGRERSDIWGISDLEMFEVALDVFDAQEGPFFAFIQTSGNHRPYTIPEYTDGFEPATGPDDATLAAGGFKSLEAYNGFRFMDHSLGRFFAHARTKPWYRDTIFALYGDHGVPSVSQLPYEQINLTHQHVPLVLHAPRLLPEPGRSLQPVSSLDILPTCLSLMGVPYLNTAMGQDAFAPPGEFGHFAFVQGGLMLEDGLTLRYDDDGTHHLYEIGGPTDPVREVTDEQRQRLDQAEKLYSALVEWSKWGLYNNKPRPQRPLE